jgi:uncharacterized protein (DUF2062 family)
VGRVKKGFVRRRLTGPLTVILKQGVTPEKIALSIALGVALGVFPVLGSTTILCALAAILLRLNLPAIQLVNYLIYPLQIALLLPLMRLGGWFFDADPIRFSPAQILAMIRTDLWQAVVTLGGATLHAVLAWLCLGPIVAVLLYLLLIPVLRGLRGSAFSAPRP